MSDDHRLARINDGRFRRLGWTYGAMDRQLAWLCATNTIERHRFSIIITTFADGRCPIGSGMTENLRNNFVVFTIVAIFAALELAKPLNYA